MRPELAGAIPILLEAGFTWRAAECILSRDAPDLRLVAGRWKKLYLDRWIIRDAVPSLDILGLSLHCLWTADPRPDPHDHPWDFESTILSGGYVQLEADGERRTYRAGDRNVRRAEDPHRIVELLEVPTWTFLVHGAPRREWGFTLASGWVHWSRYPNSVRPGR